MESREKYIWMLEKILQAVILLILFSGCVSSDSDDQPYPPPDMLGLWGGEYRVTLQGVDLVFPIDVNITTQSQYGGDFSGEWKSTSDSSWPDDHFVDGHAYSWSGGANVRFTLTSGNETLCCAAMFGCFYKPLLKIEMKGFLANDSVTDPEADYQYICGWEIATMTLSRQTSS